MLVYGCIIVFVEVCLCMLTYAYEWLRMFEFDCICLSIRVYVCAGVRIIVYTCMWHVVYTCVCVRAYAYACGFCVFVLLMVVFGCVCIV